MCVYGWCKKRYYKQSFTSMLPLILQLFISPTPYCTLSHTLPHTLTYLHPYHSLNLFLWIYTLLPLCHTQHTSAAHFTYTTSLNVFAKNRRAECRFIHCLKVKRFYFVNYWKKSSTCEWHNDEKKESLLKKIYASIKLRGLLVPPFDTQ